MTEIDRNKFVPGEFFDVKTEDLTPNIDQARKFFSAEAHEELTKSTSNFGLLHPINSSEKVTP